MVQMLQKPSHWYVIRLSAMGDVVLTTGVLAYWMRTRGWSFTVITKSAFAPIFNNHPAVREVIALKNEDLPISKLLPFFSRLVAESKGSGLLDLHGTLRSHILSMLWQGPVLRMHKMSLERRIFLLSKGKLFRQKLLDQNVPQRYAASVETQIPSRSELLPCLFLTQEEKDNAQKTLKKSFALRSRSVLRSADLDRQIAIHPYAAHSGKAWSVDHWQTLVQKLDSLGYCSFVIGQSEKSLPLGIPPERDFTNKTSLRETCALLSAADLLITGDSGPMHLASGVQMPVVALFGPTTAEWGFMPAGSQDKILEPLTAEGKPFLCRPCSLHGKEGCVKKGCMAAIDPDRVLSAVQEILSFPKERR